MKIRRTLLCAEMLEDRCVPATWGNPWPDASHLTLSFAPDGTPVGNHTSNLFQTLNAIAPTAVWENTILRAFQTWASQANINLTVVADAGLPFGVAGSIQSDPRFGDIRIAAYAMPVGAEAFATPFELDAGTWSGDVQLNSAASFGVNGGGQYDLYTVMLHEAGHVFGLDDNSNPASVMDVQYLGARTGLGTPDVTALQAIYGARTPDAGGNNTRSSATPLNSLANLGGVLSTTVNADLATLQDVDFYSFNTLLNLGQVDVTLRTAGISLLTPAVTVFNAAGRAIASAVDTDPQQGGFVIHLSNIRPLTTYTIEVQSGQQNVFGIGSYALTLSEVPLVTNLLARMTMTVTQGVGAAANALIDNGSDPNNSFATATPLPPLQTGPNGSSFVSYQGSLGASTDVDYFQLQTPAASAESAGAVLTAMVWGLQDAMNAQIRVYDAQHNLVPAEVVVNDSFTYTVQISNPTPSANYFVEVLAANPNGGQSVGNYFLGLDVSPNVIALQNFESASLTASQPAVLNTLAVSEISQLFHFVLSASSDTGSTTAGTVQMTIVDPSGQTVFTLQAGTTAPVSSNVLLQPGAYTVLVASMASAGGTPTALSFLLRGDILTSPIGPESTDPTQNPGGLPNPDPQNQDTWTDGSTTGVGLQDPSGDPYTGSNQTTVSLFNPGDQTNDGGDQVSLSLQAYDSAQNALTFSATGLPDGLSIASSGVISGAIALDAVSSTPYLVTISAADNTAGASANQSFYWTVNPPVVTLFNPGDQTNLAGDTVNLSVYGSSTDGDALTYTATGLPPGVSIDPNSGAIAGTIPNNAASTAAYVVTISATDASAGVSANVTLNWTVNPPIVTLNNPGDQTNLAGDTVNLSVSGWCTDGDALTFTATGLPPGLSIDPNSGAIAGTIPNNAASSTAYVVTITATDTSSGVSANVTLNWTVNSPVATLYNPGDQTNLAGDTVNLSVSGWCTDGCALTYAATGLPPGLSLDPNSGAITGTIPNNAAGNTPYVVTITATDASSGVSANVTLNWTVNPPVVTLFNPGDQTNLAGDTVNLSVSGWCTDGCALTYAATGLPPGLSLDPNSGAITGTIPNNAAGNTPYVVTITATDASSGVSANVTLNWTVNPPVVTLFNPGDQTNLVGDQVNVALSASDTDGNNLVYNATGLPPGLTIDSGTGVISGTIAASAAGANPYFITITATDASANVSGTQTFNWTV